MSSLNHRVELLKDSRSRMTKSLVFVFSLFFTISAGASGQKTNNFSNIKIKNFGQVDERLYRGALTGSGLAWLHRPATPLEGRHVILADDILDEGHTLKAVRDWCEDQGAAKITIAVLCVKQHDRRVEGVEADYVALEVPDRYVYGYGMDFHEQGRNLPGIYALGN